MFNSSFGTVPSIEERRATVLSAIAAGTDSKFPSGFPSYIWNNQQTRYLEYWAWFNGDLLNERKASQKDSKPSLKYPLGVNPVRNFSRKGAQLLIGEADLTSSAPLIKTKVKPEPPLYGDGESNDEERKLAVLVENVVNRVWSQSNGSAIQMENAVQIQFLGGCIFQVSYEIDMINDFDIPIKVKNWPADFFLPIWKADDPWDLLEAYLVYKMPTASAWAQYGVGEAQTIGWVIYVEHWTKSSYSIYLDGKPLSTTVAGDTVTYQNLPNPFGFVPFVYIPHLREGNFFGPSMVEDIRGLVREFNARSADIGDAIRDTVHRKRWMRNVENKPIGQQLSDQSWVWNLGRTNPSTKADPDIFTEDPIEIPESVASYTEKTWTQLLREGNLSDVAFGAEDRAQRTALSIAFRMFPAISHARAERVFWTTGLNLVARFIVKMVLKKNLVSGMPADVLKRVSITQDWAPFIPVDHESKVNEINLRVATGTMSPQTAMDRMGDIEYIGEEMDRVMEWLQFQAEIGKPQKPANVNDKSGPKPVTIKASQDTN